jgi:hypothetical protein
MKFDNGEVHKYNLAPRTHKAVCGGSDDRPRARLARAGNEVSASATW